MGLDFDIENFEKQKQAEVEEWERVYRMCQELNLDSESAAKLLTVHSNELVFQGIDTYRKQLVDCGILYEPEQERDSQVDIPGHIDNYEIPSWKTWLRIELLKKDVL